MRILVFWMPKRTIRFAKTHVRIPQEKDLGARAQDLQKNGQENHNSGQVHTFEYGPLI